MQLSKATWIELNSTVMLFRREYACLLAKSIALSTFRYRSITLSLFLPPLTLSPHSYTPQSISTIASFVTLNSQSVCHVGWIELSSLSPNIDPFTTIYMHRYFKYRRDTHIRTHTRTASWNSNEWTPGCYLGVCGLLEIDKCINWEILGVFLRFFILRHSDGDLCMYTHYTVL